MPTIDADAHVVENEQIWDYLEGDERQFRPKVLRLDAEKGAASQRGEEFWSIDGETTRKGRNYARAGAPKESAELTDVQARLRHMDELGIDIQVLFPTFVAGLGLMRPATQVALTRAYHRFLANVWRESNGRLRWVVMPPYPVMSECLEALRFGKQNGACGVMLHGLQGERVPTDTCFTPIYEEAERLGLPICIHAGGATSSNHHFRHMFHSNAAIYWNSRAPVVAAFDGLARSGFPERYPDLRWGFIEASASWIPYMFHHIPLSFERRDHKQFDPEFMSRYRFYVAIETNDDLPDITKYCGEDRLVLGTDYGHDDGEPKAFQMMKEIPGLSPSILKKTLDDNARALFGIEAAG